jgi:hypothetical protein
MSLFIMLLNFDTEKFYASLAHASITWALQLFLWSYMVIVFFILLNVSRGLPFLACVGLTLRVSSFAFGACSFLRRVLVLSGLVHLVLFVLMQSFSQCVVVILHVQSAHLLSSLPQTFHLLNQINI